MNFSVLDTSIDDVWIAASAMQHGHDVVTTDEDFERIPQIVARRFGPMA